MAVAPSAPHPVVVRLGSANSMPSALFAGLQITAADKSIPTDGQQSQSQPLQISPSAAPQQQQLHFSDAVSGPPTDFGCSDAAPKAGGSVGLSPKALDILRQVEEQNATGPYECYFGLPPENPPTKEEEKQPVPASMIAQFDSAIEGCPQNPQNEKKKKKKKAKPHQKAKGKKKQQHKQQAAEVLDPDTGISSETDEARGSDEEAEEAETKKTKYGGARRKSRGSKTAAAFPEMSIVDPRMTLGIVCELVRQVTSCMAQQQFPAIPWQQQPNQRLLLGTPAPAGPVEISTSQPAAVAPPPPAWQPDAGAPMGGEQQPQNSDSMLIARSEWDSACGYMAQLQQQNAELSAQIKNACQQQQVSASPAAQGDLSAAMRQFIDTAKKNKNELMIDGQIYTIRRRNKVVDGKRLRGRPKDAESDGDAEKNQPVRKKRAIGGTTSKRSIPQPISQFAHPDPQNMIFPIVDPNNPNAPVVALALPVPTNGVTETTIVEASGQIVNYNGYVPPQPLPLTTPPATPDPSLGGLFGSDMMQQMPPFDDPDFPHC